jgi:RHS repeat-associated protein
MVRGLRLSSVVSLVAVALAAPPLERPARAMSTGDTGVSDNLVSLPSAPGSIDGVTDNARVTPNTGAMTFSVPIDVPRGFPGATPALALSYGSFAGDGPLGIGWDLAVPAIERTTARGLPTYTTADEFAFGGSDPLVALPDAGTGVAEYRARFERSFVRFRWNAQGTGAEGYWTAETPDGSVTYYGADATGALVPSARLSAANRGTFRYYPVETVDKLGHHLVYTWAAEALPAGTDASIASVPLLRAVAWVFVQGKATYQATFSYGDRVRVVSDCDPTFEMRLTKQLTGITVTAHDKSLRTYALAYEAAGPSGGLSRLARVTSAGADGTPNPLAYTFGYTQALGVSCADPSCMPVVVQVPLTGVNTNLAAGHTSLVDLNGDALPDVIDTTGPKHKVQLSKLGADGKVSFAAPFTSAFGGGYDLVSPDVQLLDADGDGFVDILHASTGTVLANGGTSAGDWSAERPLAGATTLAALLAGSNAANVRFLDLDGDRQIDALQLTQSAANVYLNKGAGGFVLDTTGVAAAVGYDFANDKLQLSDMNGDGQQDLVRATTAGLTYWLGLGRGQWGPAVTVDLAISSAELPAVQLQDLNGDQLDDVVVVQGNVVKYAINRTAGVFDAWARLDGTDARYASLPTVTPGVVSVLFADMNGNGSTDVVWVDMAGKLTYLELFPVRPNLLTHVENGLGLVTDVSYSTTLEQEGRATTPWAHRLPHAMTVVAETKRREALGGAVEDELYAYTDAYYDPVWKQFRGFAEVDEAQESDPAQEAGRTTSIFDLGEKDPYHAGLLTSQTLESAGRTLYTEAYDYDDCAVDGVPADSAVRFVCEKARARTLVEGRPMTEWARTEIHRDYDHNGNVILESHLGVVSIGGGACGACATAPGSGLASGACGPTCLGDELTIEQQFAAPGRATGAWILGAPAVEKVYGASAAAGPVSERHTFYDGAAFVGLALGKMDKGLVTRVETVSSTTGDVVQTERNKVDADGNVVETLDALGTPDGIDHRRAYAYDATGLRVTSTTAYTSDAAGPYTLVRSYSYDPLWDKVVSASDWSLVRGATTTPAAGGHTYSYDGLGRLVAEAEAPSTIETPDRTYTYELGAPPARVIARTRSQAGGALDLEEVRCFDGKGREYERRTRVADGSFTVTGYAAFNTRDAVVSAAQPFAATSDACDTAPPAGAKVESFFRDAAERVVTTTLPSGATSHSDYGPLSTVFHGFDDTDTTAARVPSSQARTYDGLGHLVSTTRAGDAHGALTQTFFYDGLGRLGAIVDPAGKTRAQSYDVLGRPVSVTDADTGTTTFEYDALGNRTRRVDARGAAVRTTYDGLARPVAEWVEGGVDADTRVDYTYDVAPSSCGADRCANPVGRLVAASYPVGTGRGGETFGYDARGRTTRFGRTFGGGAAGPAGPDLGTQRFDVAFAYDNAGRPTATDYPGALHVAYTNDGAGRVTGVAGLVDAVTYSARGDVASVALTNGVTTTYDVDVDGLLAGIHAKDRAGAGVVDLSYERDRDGQLLSVHDGATPAGGPSSEATFSYDPLERLTKATLDPARADFTETITYAYDAQDNLTRRASSRGAASAGDLGDVTYDATRTHLPTAAGSRAYGFDGAGNTIKRGGDTLGWDGRGRLATIARAGAPVASYFYGSTRDRLVKVEDGHRTLAVAPDFDVRDGHGVFWLRLGGQLVAKVETPALATTVLSDLAPATLAGTEATPAPDGQITAGDAWLAAASKAKALDLGAAAPSDVDALLASSVRRLLAGDTKTTTFLHVDQQGSVVAATDTTGAVLYRAAYYPHGDVRASAGAPPEDVRFTGKERDDAGRVVSFGGRDADLETGRWLSPDPHYELLVEDEALERPDEATGRFRFADNNAPNRVDRDGRFPWAAFGAAVGGVVGGATEIWKQRALDGRVTSWPRVLFKAATGAAFGALSAGISVVSTVVAARAEVSTYRSKVAEARDGAIRPLTSAEDAQARKSAARRGFAWGLGVGLVTDFGQALFESAITSLVPAAAGELDHTLDGTQFFESTEGHFAEVAMEPATDAVYELGAKAGEHAEARLSERSIEHEMRVARTRVNSAAHPRPLTLQRHAIVGRGYKGIPKVR